MRTFIAIELPLEIKEHLGDIARRLRRSDVNAGWVKPDNYHLTLKFLGEIDESLMPPLTGALGQLCEQHNAFTTNLYGLGFFPTPKRPRVLYAAIKEQQPFSHIASHLDRLLEPLGFPPEQRFTPHITLARIKNTNNLQSLRQLMSDITLDISFDVTAISFFRSTLQRDGACYERLSLHPLNDNSTLE